MADASQAGSWCARAEGARDQQWRRGAADGAALDPSGLSAQRGRDRPRHGGLRRPIMKRPILVALTGFAGLMVGGCSSGLGEVSAKPVSYKLPNETAAFKPGPNLETVQDNCTACHSAHYVQTHPRGAKFKQDCCRPQVTQLIK